MKRRVAEAEATKRAQQEGDDVPAKFVKFDPETAISEPNPKQPRTTLYSPVYADEISCSPATSSTSRHVRRPYDKDKLECGLAEEPWDWELCESHVNQSLQVRRLRFQKMRRSAEDFSTKVLPTVTEDELAWLDQEAVHAEL